MALSSGLGEVQKCGQGGMLVGGPGVSVPEETSETLPP